MDSAGIDFPVGGSVDEVAKLTVPMSKVLICRLWASFGCQETDVDQASVIVVYGKMASCDVKLI